jgi:ferredoxin
MNPSAEQQARIAFYLTGRRAKESGALVSLRPALQSGYRDLSKVRHDFPLLLANQVDAPVQSFTALVDAAIQRIAKGDDADRTRRQVLRVEQEVRKLLAEGAQGSLDAIWKQAVQRLAGARDASFTDSARRARAAIAADGPLVDCDDALPERLLRHVWQQITQHKAAAFGQRVVRAIQGLSDILRADFERSEGGRSAAQLKASVGSTHSSAFDFDAMSRLLSATVPRVPMPAERRERIRRLLAVLDAQSFVALPDAEAARAAGSESYDYLFDSCQAALVAWHERLPQLVELARALTMAELEIEGLYSAARHDALFAAYGAGGLESQELAQFPDYLVCLDGGALDAAEQARLMEILAGELPIKVLYRIDDLLDTQQGSPRVLGPGLRGRQLAHMAMGLNQVYVLQSPASNLYRCAQRVADGMDFAGPALFCIFSGVRGGVQGQAPYLTAAAAMESRAFPAFVYDPSAGPNWAARFSLEGNPQPELDWPIHRFDYEDSKHQRMTKELAFTFVDFAAADPRLGDHLMRLGSAADEQGLVAVDEALTRDRRGLPERVPCVYMVDDEDRLHTAIVDEHLLREARRRREMWHSLQELGGVHNSHAQRLLARERAAWDERHAREAAALPAVQPLAAQAPAMAKSEPVAPAAPQPEDQGAQHSPDEAYIETARCSTCNECTQINPKMFAYDANKQAYIADIKAGTYAQLVEAAESCQVSVIHPGKPRDPNEPGLEELLARAEPFR